MAKGHGTFRERERLLRELRGRYAKCGKDVLDLIVQEFIEEGDLRQLVSRLVGRTVIDPDAQHRVILAFLKRRGEPAFLAQARGRAKPRRERKKGIERKGHMHVARGEVTRDRRVKPEKPEKPSDAPSPEKSSEGGD